MSPPNKAITSKTFKDFDQLGWDTFAQRLTTFIQTESGFVDGSLVISLNAEFGRGKSTFFEMWQSELLADSSLPDAIILNAWESDFINDPLLSILFGILENLEKDTTKSEASQKIKKGIGSLIRITASLGNDLIAHTIGPDIIKAAQTAESGNLVPQDDPGEKIYADFKARAHALTHIREGLNDAFPTKDSSRLIVMVDELDRCRPDYSISYLETIKHIFDLPQLTFVLGVDKKALACVSKSLFGADLDFDEYYRKFIHRNVSLPEPNETKVFDFCSKLISDYLRSDELKQQGRFVYLKLESHVVSHIRDLAVNLSLNPRQIHEMFRILAHIHACDEKRAGRILWGWEVSSLFMIAISIKDKALYQKLGKGKVSLKEIGLFLQKFGFLAGDSEFKNWWFELLYVAMDHNEKNTFDEFFNVLKTLGLIDETSTKEEEEEVINSLKKSLGQFYQGFGLHHSYSEGATGRIFTMIEEINQFSN